MPISRRSGPKRSTQKAPIVKRLKIELAKWGIDKKTVGPILLTLLITAILRQLGVAFELAPGVELSENEAKVKEILNDLDKRGQLVRLTKRIPKETLTKALKAMIVDQDILNEYDVDEIPSKYSEKIDEELLSFLQSQRSS